MLLAQIATQTEIPFFVLLLIGVISTAVIVSWSYMHWRSAVKIAFIAVLVEGAIRKWLLPQGQELAYFLKDIFLLGAYLRFFLTPSPDIRALTLRIPTFPILAMSTIVCFSALNPNINSLLIAAYGIKIYFYYLPLVFMMPFLFRSKKELISNFYWYAAIGIPICLLGLLQWQSDTFSVINTYAGGMEESGATTFGFGDKARITGTFSYITGHTTFVIFFSALNLLLLSWEETKKKWLIMTVSLPLLAANAFMGGSRATITCMIFMAVGFLLASFMGKVRMSRQFVTTLITGALLATLGAVYFFIDAVKYLNHRFESSADGFTSRIFGHTIDALIAGLEDGGFIGFGMGTTHPATFAIRNALQIDGPFDQPPLYDHEMGQVLVELGVLGFLCWYGIRVTLLVLCWNSFNKAGSGPFASIALATCLISIPFFLMSIVLNHTASFLLFAMIGLSLTPFVERTIQRSRAARHANKNTGLTQSRS